LSTGLRLPTEFVEVCRRIVNWKHDTLAFPTPVEALIPAYFLRNTTDMPGPRRLLGNVDSICMLIAGIIAWSAPPQRGSQDRIGERLLALRPFMIGALLLDGALQ
jgi:hypothetical protein